MITTMNTLMTMITAHGHSHSHSHDHGHHHHHHGHDDVKMEFDGEILYPDPICDDDVLIEILEDMVKDAL